MPGARTFHVYSVANAAKPITDAADKSIAFFILFFQSFRPDQMSRFDVKSTNLDVSVPSAPFHVRR